MTIPDLRAKTIADLGYTGFFGGAKSYSDLSPAEQVNVTNAMEAYIAANPDQFTDTQAGIATQAQQAGGIPSIQDYTVAQAAEDFKTEVENQAISLNNNLNPFSEQNRKLTYFLLLGGGILWFFGPKILAALKKK